MAKQLVFLWSFVLFLAPAPAVGDYNSNCTVGDSPGKAQRTIVMCDVVIMKYVA